MSKFAIKKLLNSGFQGSYHLGRFLLIRKSYSFFRNQQQRLFSRASKKSLTILNKSIFEDIPVVQGVEKMRQQGVSFGLQLPPSMVEEIYQYACKTPCTEPKFDGEFFIQEVKQGCLRGERQVVRALVRDVMGCKAINKIVQDPLLLEIVHEYLHYWPTKITRHLTWSVASSLTEQEIRRLYPPSNYHYDVAGYNFMTIYFYITDVDAFSGPHVMIRGSHNQKPLSMVFSSARQTDTAVLNHYGKENESVIEGKKGFGFVQDPSCFHKVLPPITRNRLLLQIRYS